MKLPKFKMPKISPLFWVSIVGLIIAIATPRVLVVPVFYGLCLGPTIYGVHKIYRNAALARAKRREDKLANETPTNPVSA